MIPLTVDVTLVLLGPVILVISLLLRVVLVLMVPRDLEFPLLLVVSHRLVVPSALLAGSPVSRCPHGLFVRLILLAPLGFCSSLGSRNPP